MTNIFATNQFLIVGLFLIALIGLMVLVRRFRDPLASQLGGQRRIKLIEDTSIGATERIKLVTIDTIQYAIITSKNQQPVVVPLEDTGTDARKSAPKPAALPKATPTRSQAGAEDTGRNSMAEPFLQAMKKARSRNPLLGFDK
ncbi:hypothetical protein AB8880_08440 [Alphaproteobacteria bacterium LSUCC0684]